MARIAGRVIDSRQKPLKGVRVTFTGTHDQDGDERTSAANGGFRTKNLKAGDYRWIAEREGLVAQTGSIEKLKSKSEDIRLEIIMIEAFGSLAGQVSSSGTGLQGIVVSAEREGASNPALTNKEGQYSIPNLPEGLYTVSVSVTSEFVQPAPIKANVKAGSEARVDFRLVRAGPGPGSGQPTSPTAPIPGSTSPSTPGPGPTTPSHPTRPTPPREIQDLFTTLENPAFSIEAQISEEEAGQAITLFALVSILIAGGSMRRVGSKEKTDVLGVLTLFYGLQDKSITSKIVVNTRQLVDAVLHHLKGLRDRLEVLGQDSQFLMREAKRQFNLGLNNDVEGNVLFPKMFIRYVGVAADPVLALDLRKEREDAIDKERVARAFDLLRDLKDVILRLVRSLSKYGTLATSQTNLDWAGYQSEALQVLLEVANARISDDKDDKNPWSVLADLTGKNRDAVIAPYVALARNGTRLLEFAVKTYQQEKDGQLENFEEDHLLDIFQKGAIADFLTTRMRAEATVIKRYPLANWG